MLKHIKIEVDRGTPARTSSETVELTIDGNAVRVPKGTSLMRAASDAGIQVPKLCATDSLEPFGSCRLCLVEIDGRKEHPHPARPLQSPAWWCTPKRPSCKNCARV